VRDPHQRDSTGLLAVRGGTPRTRRSHHHPRRTRRRSGRHRDRPRPTETGFHRAEHLLQIPDNSATHQHLDGVREDTEAGFSQFDRSLWNRRMIAFGAEAQSLVVLSFLLAQNATSAARCQEDPTYTDADAEPTGLSDGPRQLPRSRTRTEVSASPHHPTLIRYAVRDRPHRRPHPCHSAGELSHRVFTNVFRKARLRSSGDRAPLS
jgi:hypothetical protein